MKGNLLWKRFWAMAEKLEYRGEVMTFEEALKVEMVVNQALIDLLITKGVITQEEIMGKIKEIKQEQGIVLSP